ncbi:MAG: hypothetical protein JWO54_691 [Candidatus Saccharibacteria bacterium]|nr:hypothetical protein [Candidatus Saccharibacteria bacterium]MDB5180928.1 hypothetical protein [Candidatus Saccharibacteria bacterium]
MTDSELQSATQRKQQAFKQRLDRMFVQLQRLHKPFIESRFRYLVEYFEQTTGEPYTPEGLAEVLTGFRYEAPGSEVDPWSDFTDRDASITEEEYRSVLFHTHVGTPMELFVVEFNDYLGFRRVPAQLIYNRSALSWTFA